MTTLKYFAGVLFLVITVFACQKDTTLRVKEQAPKLVIHAVAVTDQPFVVFVSKSAGVLDRVKATEDLAVRDAQIFLYADGVLTDSFQYNGPFLPYTAWQGTLARAGVQYTLTAVAPGLAAIEAETFLHPDFPVFAGATLSSQVKKINGEWMDEIRILFSDPPEVANYYILRILNPYSYGGNVNYHGIYSCIYSNDPDARNGSLDPISSGCIDDEIFMDDKNFDGRQKELILFVPTGSLYSVDDAADGNVYRPIVQITNVTADYSKYRKSIELYNNASENPFAEPVSIFTNIRNGYGVFALEHVQTDTIR